MTLSRPNKQSHRPACVLLAMLVSPAFADTSFGPDPYAAGYGFDLPSEAAWGGWTRDAEGTLYAEWDVFNDKSHGGADDRSAAPDLGNLGTSSAWLGWSTGTFVSGTGNLYSFTLPESFSIDLTGTVPAAPLRVVLQVETQGQLLNYDSFKLNNATPTQATETYRNAAFPSPLGPTDLVHRLFIWDLPTPPSAFVFHFSSKEPHVSLTQAAVDIGPQTATNPGPPLPPEPEPSATQDRTVLAKLSAEELDANLATQLHAQYPRWFPATWADQELTFTRKTDKKGQRITEILKGGIPALFQDVKTGGSNRVYLDIYRPDEAGDVKIAECQPKATKIRRWKKVTLDDGISRYGTALYRLELKAVAWPDKPKKNKFTKRFGLCDVDLATAGIQPGVPALLNGDYAVFRRESD
jgi:hypothetical protein